MSGDPAGEVLATLATYDDFISQLEVIADMGSGDGRYSNMLATIELEDGTPLMPTVMAVDDKIQMDNRYRTKNIRQIRQDFSDTSIQEGKVDMIWCHDAFQFAHDPWKTLRHWHKILRPSGMLLMSVPQTAFIDDLSRWQVYQQPSCYHSWNMVNLIQVLATCGFDCREGFLRQRRHDPLLWAAVYKSDTPPMDPATTTWYDLMDAKLLPLSAEQFVLKTGFLRLDAMVLQWLDRNNYDLAVEMMP